LNKFVSFAKVALLFVSCSVIVASCSSEDEDFSIIGSWVATGGVFSPAVMIDSVAVTDAFNLFWPDACDQDDIIILQEAGVMIMDQGALMCDSTDMQQETASYAFIGSTLYLMESSGDTTAVITNVAITAATMTGSMAVNMGGTAANVNLTMTRQ
jgi:hypothetical protein